MAHNPLQRDVEGCSKQAVDGLGFCGVTVHVALTSTSSTCPPSTHFSYLLSKRLLNLSRGYFTRLAGKIPVEWKPLLTFDGVRQSNYTRASSSTNSAFVKARQEPEKPERAFKSASHFFFNGSKHDTSRGWRTSVTCGGNFKITFSEIANSITFCAHVTEMIVKQKKKWALRDSFAKLPKPFKEDVWSHPFCFAFSIKQTRMMVLT